VMADPVDHPKHYNTGKIEVIDAIEDWKLGFHEGNVIKYVACARHKGNELEDLRKAAWYLNRAIEKLEENQLRITPADVLKRIAPRLHLLMPNALAACGEKSGVAGATTNLNEVTCGNCLIANQRALRTVHIADSDDAPVCGFTGACDVTLDPEAATCIVCKRISEEKSK
jgi:hypothetical protein